MPASSISTTGVNCRAQAKAPATGHEKLPTNSYLGLLRLVPVRWMNLPNLLRVLQNADLAACQQDPSKCSGGGKCQQRYTAAGAAIMLNLYDVWQMQAFSEAFAVHDACKSRRSDRAAVLIAMADICMMTG